MKKIKKRNIHLKLLTRAASELKPLVTIAFLLLKLQVMKEKISLGEEDDKFWLFSISSIF